jgi:hypothetical protein
MRPELLSTHMAALSPDTLAAMDGPGAASVRLFDTAQVAGAARRAAGPRLAPRWRAGASARGGAPGQNAYHSLQ